MKVERFVIQACCGKKGIVFKIDRPIDMSLLQYLKSNGFKEAEHFTRAGMLYADNMDLIVSGPIGADKMNVKCKKADCNQIFNCFEALLLKMG
jgi:hypothetical protein